MHGDRRGPREVCGQGNYSQAPQEPHLEGCLLPSGAELLPASDLWDAAPVTRSESEGCTPAKESVQDGSGRLCKTCPCLQCAQHSLLQDLPCPSKQVGKDVPGDCFQGHKTPGTDSSTSGAVEPQAPPSLGRVKLQLPKCPWSRGPAARIGNGAFLNSAQDVKENRGLPA